MDNEQKPTIDERLQALTMNLELMAREMEETKKRQDEADRRERKGRQAILRGIAEYLRALNGEDDSSGE